MLRTRFYFLFLLIPFAWACADDVQLTADLYSAMPKTSVVVLESNNLYESFKEIKQTNVFSEFDSLPTVLAYGFDVAEITALLPEDSIETFFEDRPFLVSLALSGAKKYSLLYATVASTSWQKKLSTKLEKHYSISTYNYANQQITKIKAQTNFYFCSVNGLLLASGNKALLEESVRQTLSGFNLKHEPNFDKLYQTANKKEQGNIYVNLKEISGYLNILFPKGQTGFLTKIGTWAELDLEVLNKEVLLSGLTLIPNNEQCFLSAFDATEAQNSLAPSVLPLSVSKSVAYTFDNAEKWHRNFAALEKEKGDETRILDFQRGIMDKFSVEADANLLFWIDTEVGVFSVSNGMDENTKVAFLQYRDMRDATNSLEALADSSFILGYRGTIIKRLALSNPHRSYFGMLFSEFPNPYYFEHKGFILYTGSLGAAKSLIDDYLASNTLANNAAFEDFTEMLTSKAHVHCLAASTGFLKTMLRTLSENEKEIFKESAKHLQNFNYAAAQLTVKDDAAYTNLYLKHNPAKKEKVSRLWSTVLEAPAISTPQFVTNHGNQKGEILIQDANFKLYLIDRQGEILWKKQLEGVILGGISQIDILKNKKLQYVFNTATKVYVLDRLGRYVEHFPISLKKAANASMAVFDYDNNRNYRLLIPSGENLLNYGVDGKPVEGWKFASNKSIITTIPQLIKVGNKETICVLTENGALRFLYRNGKERYKTQTIENLKGKLFYYKGNDLKKAQLVGLTNRGKLAYINTSGGNETLPLDVDAKAEHYLFFDEKQIYTVEEELINKNTVNPWSIKLNGNISSTPKVMIFRGDFYAAAFCANTEEITLLNKNGEIIDGFPVFAQGAFDMGSLNRNSVINIVTTMKDGTVVCYAVF